MFEGASDGAGTMDAAVDGSRSSRTSPNPSPMPPPELAGPVGGSPTRFSAGAAGAAAREDVTWGNSWEEGQEYVWDLADATRSDEPGKQRAAKAQPPKPSRAGS